MYIPEWVLLLTVPAIVGFSIWSRINLGLIGFLCALALGELVLQQPITKTLEGVPVRLMLTVIGLTLMISVASRNGTVDWLVAAAFRLCGGRVVLVPALLFLLGFVSAVVGPGSAPVLMLVGAKLALRVGINPVFIGAMAIHGLVSGGYSPVSPVGVVVASIARDSGLEINAVSLFTTVTLAHVALAFVVFFAFRGPDLSRLKMHPRHDIDDPGVPVDGSVIQRWVTLAGFLSLMVFVVVWRFDVGTIALAVGTLLLLLQPRAQREKSLEGIAWQVVLMIAGTLTYISTLKDTGAISWLAHALVEEMSPGLVALALGYFTSVVTGLASTIGTIGLLVPIAEPVIAAGDFSPDRMISFLAISAAVSDVSPFSTYGAMFLATMMSVQTSIEREGVHGESVLPYSRHGLIVGMLGYVGMVILLVPPIAWFFLLCA